MNLLSRQYFALRDPVSKLFMSGIPTTRKTTFTEKAGTTWARRGAAEMNLARYHVYRTLNEGGGYDDSPEVLEIVQTDVVESISVHAVNAFDFGKALGRMVTNSKNNKYEASDEMVMEFMAKLATKDYHPNYVFLCDAGHEMVTKTRSRLMTRSDYLMVATISEEDMVVLSLELADCTKAIYNFVNEKIHVRQCA